MWFTETPWPPIAICGVAAGLLLIAWFRNARSLYLTGIVGLGIAAVLIFFIEQAVVTETENVERLQLELVEAVKEDDLERVLSHISDSSLTVRLKVRGGMTMVRVNSDLSITDDSARWSDDGKTIISHMRANGRASLKPKGQAERHFPTRWEFDWVRNSDNEWKIVDIRRLNPLTGEVIGWTDAAN